MAIIFAAASDIEQSDENTFGADSNRVVKITGNALAEKLSSDLRAADRRKYGGDDLNGGRTLPITRMKQRMHGLLQGKLTQQCEAGQK